MLLCLKEHSKKGSQELTFCTRIGIGFAIVEMAHSHSMAKKLSKELSKKHSKKQIFYTRIGPQLIVHCGIHSNVPLPIRSPREKGSQQEAHALSPSNTDKKITKCNAIISSPFPILAISCPSRKNAI